MKPLKALSTTIILGVVLVSGTGCNDFVSTQSDPVQEIFSTANSFYDVLEKDSNYDIYANQTKYIHDMTNAERKDVIASLPGGAYLDVSSDDKSAGAFSFLDHNVSFIESRRMRYETIVDREKSSGADIPFRKVDITVPENSISIISDTKASIDTKLIIITVDDEQKAHDQYANKPILIEKNSDNEWKISFSDENSSKIW